MLSVESESEDSGNNSGRKADKITDALGDVGGGVAGGGEVDGEGGVEGEAEVGVVAVLDEQAEALLALVDHLLQPRAAVYGGRFGLRAHVGQAGSQPHQLIRALLPVL